MTSNASSATARPLVIALMGPTASGKTALAMELATQLDLAVLSVDSRQLYRHMDVGTAKPTAAQRNRVRHELLDLREPNQPINLREFIVIARAAIEAEHRRRGIAFLVGGSGLYLKALLKGWNPRRCHPSPSCGPSSNPSGNPCAINFSSRGSHGGGRIAPRRCGSHPTGSGGALRHRTPPLRPATQHCPPPWRVLEMGLNPPDLKQRIERRTHQLYSNGLVRETKELIERYGVGPAPAGDHRLWRGETGAAGGAGSVGCPGPQHSPDDPVRKTAEHLVPAPASAALAGGWRSAAKGTAADTGPA
jgi:tRNA dimethylallyltransferase